jgi:hypothetical protein
MQLGKGVYLLYTTRGNPGVMHVNSGTFYRDEFGKISVFEEDGAPLPALKGKNVKSWRLVSSVGESMEENVQADELAAFDGFTP